METNSLDTYQIVFIGKIRSGFDLENVKENCRQIMNLNDEQLDRMFSGEPIVLKKGADAQKASNFIKKFQEYGLQLHAIIEKDYNPAFTLEPLEKVTKEQWQPPELISIHYRKPRHPVVEALILPFDYVDEYFKGRINISGYVDNQLKTALAFFCLIVIVFFLKGQFHNQYFLNIILSIFGFLAYGRFLHTAVLRLHDINRSWVWGLVSIIPFVFSILFPTKLWLTLGTGIGTLTLFFSLPFFPGAEGENRYGPEYIKPKNSAPKTEEEQSQTEQSVQKALQRYTERFTKTVIPEGYWQEVWQNESAFFLDRYVRGRIDRFRYIIIQTTMWLSFSVFILLMSAIFGKNNIPTVLNIFIFLIGFILYFNGATLSVLRLHDINLSGIYIFIGIVTIGITTLLSALFYSKILSGLPIFVNGVIFFILSYMPPVNEENKFGSPKNPLACTQNQKYIYIGTPIALAIIGIIIILLTMK